MSDSSDNDELFGSESENHEENERLNAITPPPDYVASPEFVEFTRTNGIDLNPKYGYIFAHTYKPFYFPGEIVRGSIILDFFNDLPKNYKKVMLRIKGQEYVNKHHEKVKAAVMKAQNLARINNSLKVSGDLNKSQNGPAMGIKE